MDALSLFILSLTSTLNTAYKWGGNNPLEGFDCSGLVQWGLKSIGLDPPGDQTAQGLYDYFSTRGNHCAKAIPGTIVFYSPTKSLSNITHVAVRLNQFQIIEAGGGGSLTLTYKDAAAQGACVRIRHIRDREHEIVAQIRPDLSVIGLI